MTDVRHVYGTIAGSGSPITIEGCSVKKVSDHKGLYDVTFDQPFQHTPAATVAEANPDEVDSTGGSTKSNANFVYIRNNAMRVKVGDSDGKGKDRTFSFIVIGV